MRGSGGATLMLADVMAHKSLSDANNVDIANATAQAATYGGAVSAVASWHLSLPEWAALVSMTVAVLGFLLQVMLAIRVFYRDAHEARVEREAARIEREEQRSERTVTRSERKDEDP